MKPRLEGAFAASLLMAAALVVGAASPASAVDPERLLFAEKEPQNWLTYHGTYKGWHHSPLTQINTENVGQLRMAFMHQPGRATRGVQSMPLAVDGVLYYSGSYSRVFALDGASGEVLWSYTPELDEDLVARQTHSPYNRGMAAGHGNLYIGTVDGRLIALDMKTGQPAWDTKLIDSAKLTVGFTGAPLLVKDKVIIGSQGGEWPGRGPIFGVDAKSGEKKWEFLTVAGTEEAMKTGAMRAGAPAAAAAGCPVPTMPRPTQSGGGQRTRRRSTTGAVPTGRPKVPGPATISTPAR